MENESALKHMYDKNLLSKMANAIVAVYPAFPKKRFALLVEKLASLEMKPRVRLIRDELKILLPDDYPRALNILLKSLKVGKLEGFILWPYTEFIQEYGLEYRDISLKALREITKHFTAEWGVRPFLRLYPKETFHFLLDCTQDKHISVRRWASEGSRPRLPWGERLHKFMIDPYLTLPILENLKLDPELFVRKSVANHLNDITKDHPDFVIKILKKWKKQAANATDQKNIDWIIRHALRTLIKAGNTSALELIGVSSKIEIKFSKFKVSQKNLKMNDRLVFDFEIKSQSSKKQRIVVDYILHFVKANKKTAPKVFKLKEFDLLPLESKILSKSHHMKEITTRVFYPGVHYVEVQINGIVVGKCAWTLEL